MSDDPRREPDWELPPPVEIPAGREQDPFFRYTFDQAKRRDMMDGLVLDTVRSMQEAEIIRRQEEQERREHYDEERRAAEDAMAMIASAQRETSVRLGEFAGTLMAVQAELNVVVRDLGLVQQQSQENGKRIAALSGRVETLSAHLDAERRDNEHEHQANAKRIGSLEVDVAAIKSDLADVKARLK